jgi:hypothetical protein
MPIRVGLRVRALSLAVAQVRTAPPLLLTAQKNNPAEGANPGGINFPVNPGEKG